MCLFAVLPVSAQIEAPGSEPQGGDERLAKNVAIVFDASGSMKGARLTAAKSSLSSFMKAVPENWNVGLIVFDTQGVREILQLGKHTDRELQAAITPITAGGKTPLGKSIFMGRNMLLRQQEKQQGYGSYMLLIVTDGEASDREYMIKASQAFGESGYDLSVIGFQLSSGHTLRDYASDYREAGNQVELEKAMQEAVAETDTQAADFDFEPLEIADADLEAP